MKHPPSHSRRPIRGLIAAAMTAFVLGACADLGEQSPTGLEQDAERPAAIGDLMQQDFGPAIEAADRYSAALMNNPNIVGTGVGLNEDGLPSVRLFLMHGQVSGLPSHLDDVPVSSAVTGPFVLRQDRTARARPAPLGFSLGHPDITAGTLGARVTDGTNVFILSNNHILANSNDATIGDPSLQPGPFDGGSAPDDSIGTLYDFEPFDFDNDNQIDAAIALVNGDDVSGSTPSTAGYGTPSTSVADAFVGQGVQKYGRTTGHTFGEVEEINVTVTVCIEGNFFGCTSAATFVNQISISDGNFSDGGDSGSLIVDTDGNKPVGLLFAGSSTRTLANEIQLVLDRFGVTIDPGEGPGDGGDPGDGDNGDDPDPEPEGPTASFTYSCDELACTFDASGSAAGDASITDYAWTFGDGATGSGETTSHTYGADGSYDVTLTVTDGNDLADSSTQTVSVAADDDDGDNGEVTAEPDIDTFDVNRRTTGPWSRATVQWAVSHADNALESVIIELLDENEGMLDSQSISVNGGTASGETELRSRSSPALVRLTVTDTAGNTVKETKDY